MRFRESSVALVAIAVGCLQLCAAVSQQLCHRCPANECGFLTPEDQRYICPNGNILDGCGCVSSCQCAGCPAVNTTLSCPHGRGYDVNDCPLNYCLPDPCICPANECGFGTPPDQRYTCPHGNVVDNCGCVTSCQCKDCPWVDIHLSCPHGRKTDSNGCPLNECKPEPCHCPANECGFGVPADRRYSCPNGNILDSCGCVTSCQCAGCPRVDTSLSCPNGRKTDTNGCPLNECKADQCVCPANECGFGTPPDQRYTCPHGNVLDNCGCVISCQCKDCPWVNIHVSCPHGRKTDSNGCPLNECKPELAAATEKPGNCPQNGRPSNLSCTDDSSCPGTTKCCLYNGSRYCRPALRY